jgi:cell wall-associated NlpC family hydrolase
MRNELYLLLCFSLLVLNTTVFSQQCYYVEILCDNQENLVPIKSLIEKQSWYEKDKIYVNTTTILIGPYEFEKATEIKNLVVTQMNLPANLSAQMLDDKIVENTVVTKETDFYSDENSDSEYDVVTSSSSKELNEDMLKLYNDEKIKKIIRSALKLYTTPYKWGGTNVDKGIDCSFFVKFVFSELGINLPRTSREQFKVGKPIDKEQLKCGDLIFFKKVRYRKVKGKIKKYEYINHVGIYLTNNEFIHATRGAKKVTISSLEEEFYKLRYAGARRILKDDI